MLKSSGSSCLISGRVEKGSKTTSNATNYGTYACGFPGGDRGLKPRRRNSTGSASTFETGQTWGMIESTRRYHTMRGRAAAAASVETRGNNGRGVTPTRATDRRLEARPDESFARRRPTTTVRGTRGSTQVRG